MYFVTDDEDRDIYDVDAEGDPSDEPLKNWSVRLVEQNGFKLKVLFKISHPLVRFSRVRMSLA